MERLQKFLSRAGVASRRHAEALIVDGRVKVNGKVVSELGSRVDPAKDLVLLDGKLVSPNPERKYFLFYKPPGVVTTLSDPEGRPTVGDYAQETGGRVFPVGRLDYDAEGALLLTDDGELANKLMHPSHQVPRVYLAKVKGVPDQASLQKLVDGVRLEDGMAHAVQARVFREAERNTWVKIVVTEGRQHLVKRLCAAIGHPVVRLYRPAHAGLPVTGLRPGELRALSNDEIRRVKAAADGEAQSEPPLTLPGRRHGHAAPGFEPSADDDEPEEREVPSPAPVGAEADEGVKPDAAERGGRFVGGQGTRTERFERERLSGASSEKSGTGTRRLGGVPRERGGGAGGRSFGGSRDGGFKRERSSSGERSGGSRERSLGGERSGGARGRSFGGERSGGSRASGSRERSFGDERSGGARGRSFGGERSGGSRDGGFKRERDSGGERSGGSRDRSFGGERSGGARERSFGGERGATRGGGFGGPRGGGFKSERTGGSRDGNFKRERNSGGERSGGTRERSFGGERSGGSRDGGFKRERSGGSRDGGFKRERSAGGERSGDSRGGGLKRGRGSAGGGGFKGQRPGGARGSRFGKPRDGGSRPGGRTSPRKPRGSW